MSLDEGGSFAGGSPAAPREVRDRLVVALNHETVQAATELTEQLGEAVNS